MLVSSFANIFSYSVGCLFILQFLLLFFLLLWNLPLPNPLKFNLSLVSRGENAFAIILSIRILYGFFWSCFEKVKGGKKQEQFLGSISYYHNFKSSWSFSMCRFLHWLLRKRLLSFVMSRGSLESAYYLCLRGTSFPKLWLIGHIYCWTKVCDLCFSFWTLK